MERIAMIVFFSLAASLPSWIVSAEVTNEDAGKLKRVYSVTEVKAGILESFPE